MEINLENWNKSLSEGPRQRQLHACLRIFCNLSSRADGDTASATWLLTIVGIVSAAVLLLQSVGLILEKIPTLFGRELSKAEGSA